MKKMRFIVEFLTLIIFIKIISFFPKKLKKIFCNLLGILTFDLLRIRRKVALKNLNIAFPEKNFFELKKLARETYRKFSYIFLEIALLGNLEKNALLNETIIEGKEFLDKAKNKGAILISGHFGNWERLAYTISMLGYKISVVVREQNNPYINKLQENSRKKFNVGVILRKKTLKKILKELREKKFIGILSDQDAGKKGVFLDFFGLKASTPDGAAKLALKEKIPLIFSYGVHLNKKFFCKFEKIEYSATETPEDLMQKFLKKLEEVIKKYPEQYFWMHKRWKSSIKY